MCHVSDTLCLTHCVICRLSFVVCCLSCVMFHVSCVMCHLSFFVCRLLFFICHLSFVIYHLSFVICNVSFVICHFVLKQVIWQLSFFQEKLDLENHWVFSPILSSNIFSRVLRNAISHFLAGLSARRSIGLMNLFYPVAYYPTL